RPGWGKAPQMRLDDVGHVSSASSIMGATIDDEGPTLPAGEGSGQASRPLAPLRELSRVYQRGLDPRPRTGRPVESGPPAATRRAPHRGDSDDRDRRRADDLRPRARAVLGLLRGLDPALRR